MAAPFFPFPGGANQGFGYDNTPPYPHLPPGIPTFGPFWRPNPIEIERPKHGWRADGQRVHNHRPRWAFVWPTDGKNSSSWGRLKDIATGKGPDIHVASNRERGWGWDNPKKTDWANWRRLDPSGALDDQPMRRNTFMGEWLGAGRSPAKAYDFRRRRYAVPSCRTWTDARWMGDGVNNETRIPQAFRCVHGSWYQANGNMNF
ncbi:hypothetical protein K402DRAFT_403862 [Aulographum hederae CBS 113979]|uniref:Uncharacterized protein n=1 Tax=Aulographum hederae CBS 113979 TaxID=1176131 RepID=A0A6G1H2W6_9PEZI|nr:hypothetical protein K402DRAFT_403862 [Aulographum hederae CBS 113979]